MAQLEYCLDIPSDGPARGRQELLPPRVLGSFSVGSERNIIFNNSKMPILHSKFIPQDNEVKEVNMDLKIGMHETICYNGSPIETFNRFLMWILNNQNQLRAANHTDRLLADIVCTRGVLKSVMQAPYIFYQRCEMTVLAQYFKGSIYITYLPEDDEVQERTRALTEVYGHKFEHHMTGDLNDVMDCNIEFRCVLNLQLDELSLMYPVAIDAVDQSLLQGDPQDTSAFVELTESREKSGNEYSQSWRKKYDYNKWWTENQIAGIPRLILGTRNEEGVVKTLEVLRTADIPSMAKGWKPSVCINFLNSFCNFVKEKVTSSPDEIHCFELAATDRWHIHHFNEGKVRGILPGWYREGLFPTEEVGV